MRDPNDTARLLASVAGDKYSYREMDNFTDVIERQLKLIPLVSKVERVGVLDEQRVSHVFAEPARRLWTFARRLYAGAARSETSRPRAERSTHGGRNIAVIPAGEFRSVEEIGSVAVGTTPGGAPIYLRDVCRRTSRIREPAPVFESLYPAI